MSYTTTATNSFSGNNIVIVTTVANMISGLPIVFTGNVFGNITANATFYIGNIASATQITLTSLPGGAVYAVANGSGSMTATFSTGGQQVIDTVPPGDPLDVAFEKTNVNFDQIFAAGPVGSNIQIANNTIRTTNTNGNLILSPNGIGNVVSNVNIVPNTANLRNLGSPTQRWATIYTQYIDYTAGNISFSNFSVSGNISAGGYISAAGNVTGNYILGNGSLLTGISVSTNKIFNGNSYANIATANGNVVISANGAIWSFNTNGTTAFPAFTFPNIDGANGQVLVTNGNGVIAWGNGQFSVITNQTISGNGVAGNFALAQSATSDSVFVTINGISQTPETDYTVLGNVITFTTIPIVGDVAQIRFLAGNVLNVNYSNANVAAFLPTYSGNVSANYFIGNGSQLTGIAGGTGNITFSNTTITSNTANANVTVQGNGTGNVNLGSSVSVTGNLTANYLYGNGYYLTGLLTTITNQTLAGNNVETNFTLNQTATANSVLVTVNGISQTPDIDYTVSGNVITFTTAPYTGDTMQVRFLANNFSSGGGNGDTGNITFNNTTISSNIANANIVIEALGTGEVIFRNNSNSFILIDSTASNVTNTVRISTQGTALGAGGGGIIAGSYILGNGTPTQNQNRLATFMGQGSENGTTLATPAKVRIQMMAAGNWSSGNTPTEISFFTTAVGTNAASETVRIDSTGNLIIYNGNINAAGTITAGSVSASGNIVASNFSTFGNVSASGNVYANNFVGNIAAAPGNTSIQINVNGVLGAAANFSYDYGANILYAPNAEFSGDIQSGNVTANFFIGNGSQLTGIAASYGNANVVANLAALGSNPISSTGNITTTANVSGNYFIGNGSQLTGITAASSYGNANVATFLGAYGSNTVSTTGNITSGNVLTSGLISATGNVTGDNLSGTNIAGTLTTAAQANITTVGTLGNLAVTGQANVTQQVNTARVSASGNITGGNLAISGNSATITSANYSIGYLNIPQVSFAANATIGLTDAGKHYYSTSASNLLLTIANNTSVSWTVGTAITIVNRGTANITIAQGTGVSLYLAGNSTSGNRTMTTYGMSTLMNVAANVWMINGTGVV